MPDFYRVLGLRPRATRAAIKAAYYGLAKQFHPDARAGDGAGQQIRDINRAYETLGDPAARAIYDFDRRQQRREARRRFGKLLATGVSTFVLTLCSLPVVLSWLASRPPQPEVAVHESHAPGTGIQVNRFGSSPACGDRDLGDPWPECGSALPATAITVKPQPRETAETIVGVAEDEAPAYQRAETRPDLPAQSHIRSASLDDGASLRRDMPTRWLLHQNARFGFSLKYPADVFTTEATPADVDDRLLNSGDSRAVLRITARAAGGVTLAKYRAALLAGRYAGASFDYTPQRETWFVLSGTLGEEMFYERVTFACDGRSLHSWLLTYPVAERAYFDAIVEEMHRSYRTGDAQGRRCGDPQPAIARARKQAAEPGAAADTAPF